MCELTCPICHGLVDYEEEYYPATWHSEFRITCPKCKVELHSYWSSEDIEKKWTDHRPDSRVPLLKRCPLCGDGANIRQTMDTRKYFIICSNRRWGFRTIPTKTLKRAVARWNGEDTPNGE